MSDGDRAANHDSSYQEDHTNTAEGVERSNGTKVNYTQNDLNDHAEHHGVEGDIQLRIDDFPVFGSRNGAVSSESPGASRCSRCAADSTDKGQDQERDCQRESAAIVTNGNFEDVRNWRRGEEDVFDGWENEAERDEEDEATDSVENDGSDHSFWYLCRWFLDLFAHAVIWSDTNLDLMLEKGLAYERIMPVAEVA